MEIKTILLTKLAAGALSVASLSEPAAQLMKAEA